MDVLIYQSSVGRGYIGGADEASSALAYRFRVWSSQSAFTVTASNLDPSPVRAILTYRITQWMSTWVLRTLSLRNRGLL
ncbi:hypothetical protein LB503_000564 [Fusarium chuoi]|nr:hypothetical protein LB503_000564 [Fusarium chuoi]